MWHDLAKILQDAGITPWKSEEIGSQRTPNGSDVFPNGYVYATKARQEGSGPGKIAHLRVFWIRVSSYTLVYPSSDESPPRTDLVMLSAQAKGRMPFYEWWPSTTRVVNSCVYGASWPLRHMPLCAKITLFPYSKKST